MKPELSQYDLQHMDAGAVAYYNDVAFFQVMLTKKEERGLLTEYQTLRNTVYRVILDNPVMAEKLIDHYLRLASNRKSIAKLSKRFNSNRSGLNTKVAEEVTAVFQAAMACTSKAKATRELLGLDFSVGVFEYLMDELKHEKEKGAFLVTETYEEIAPYQKRMHKIEDIMVRSCLMGASKIANKYSTKLFNVDRKDITQHANLGILTAVKKYDPEYMTIDGKRPKFFTYAFWWADKKIQEYIMGNSRLVRLPKSRLDIIFLVVEAARSLPEDEQDLEDITNKVNKILIDKKKKQPPYIVEEISMAVELLQGGSCMSLDTPQDRQSSGHNTRTLKELIPDGSESQEERLIHSQLMNKVSKLVRPRLTHIEFRVFTLRILSDAPLTMEETRTTLYSEGTTIKKFSRERVSQIEKEAIAKVQKIPTLRELLKT